jgi:hypothetical protein
MHETVLELGLAKDGIGSKQLIGRDRFKASEIAASSRRQPRSSAVRRLGHKHR